MCCTMPLKIEGTTYYTAAEVARAVGVSRQTLWRWRHAGRVPPGRRYREQQILFTDDELEVIRQYANRLEPATSTPGSSEKGNWSRE